MTLAVVRSKAVDLLFIVTPIASGCFVFGTCLDFLASFAIISVRNIDIKPLTNRIAYRTSGCTDPESFVRGGPALTTFFCSC